MMFIMKLKHWEHVSGSGRNMRILRVLGCSCSGGVGGCRMGLERTEQGLLIFVMELMLSDHVSVVVLEV